MSGDNGFDPFGWSVACSGLRPVQVRDQVKRVIEETTALWASYFPGERGYEVVVESPAGVSNGVRLMVRRGDFRAQVAVENLFDPRRLAAGERTPAVRMFGRAESDALALAERSGHNAVARCHVLGVTAGVGCFVALCWLVFGVRNPEFLLGGLLMVVAALLTTTAGSTLGAWIGERLAETRRARARRGTALDLDLQDDLRRWRALARQLGGLRTAVTGRALRGPFREALPAAGGASGRQPALAGG